MNCIGCDDGRTYSEYTCKNCGHVQQVSWLANLPEPAINEYACTFCFGT